MSSQLKIPFKKGLRMAARALSVGTVAALMIGSLPANAVSGTTATELWQINGLDQPESVIADPVNKALYITNINGAPLELNGQGYVSRADSNGNLTDKHWVTGLDAPKGMAISGNRLYIADVARVHIVDIQTGEIVKQLQAPKAKMLNDMTAAPDGILYVSDMLEGVLYRIKDDQLEPWFRSPQLQHPNGLLWHQGQLLVADWGYPINPDFTTATPGTLFQLDPLKQTLVPLATGYQLGNLDGVVAIGETLYVSDWMSGELFALDGKERTRTLAVQSGLADIGVSGNTLYAPMMHNNQVVAWRLTPQPSQAPTGQH